MVNGEYPPIMDDQQFRTWVHVTLTRLEGKLDGHIASHTSGGIWLRWVGHLFLMLLAAFAGALISQGRLP